FNGIRMVNASQFNVIGTDGDGVDDENEGNLIADSGQFGIRIIGLGTDDNVVAGNTSRDNAFEGIAVEGNASRTRIGMNSDGVSDALEGNVLFGNNNGVRLTDVHGTILAGNRIGADPDDPTSIANDGVGVAVTGETTQTRIGTDGDGVADGDEANIIHGKVVGVGVGRDVFNSTTGVPTGTSIVGNVITSLSGLGIDLGSEIVVFDGITPNDVSDADAGPNGLQNFPELDFATLSAAGLAIEGQLASQPLQNYRIDFYANDAAHPSGHGGGQTHLGWSSVTTDAIGIAELNDVLPIPTSAAIWISATATDDNGNTSEFSRLLALDTTAPSSTIEQADLTRDPGSEVIQIPVTIESSLVQGEINTDIASVDLYVSIDGGPLQLSQTSTEAPHQFEFVGQAGVSYGFKSIARDLAGNVESEPLAIDASLFVTDDFAPETQVSLIAATASGFDLAVRGEDVGTSRLARTDVYVEIDGASAERIASFTQASQTDQLSVDFSYRPFADGIAREYRFYTIGVDQLGNVESPPVDVNDDIRITHVIEAASDLLITDFDVQQGLTQRSFIRTLDLAFNQADGIDDLVDSLADANDSNDRVRLTRFDADGVSNPTVIGLTGRLSADAVDQSMRIDFGIGGIGGNPLSTQGDGYYVLELDLDGDAVFDDSRRFYRLFGDTNGDRQTDLNDFRRVAIALRAGQTGPQDADIDGDEIMTQTELFAMRPTAFAKSQIDGSLELDD
ncbi:MAG: hypothetical protein AAF745_13950, partial [Planctomycetota bacterium]